MPPLISPVSLLLLTYTVVGVVALPLADHAGHQTWTEPGAILQGRGRHDACGFDGNPDLYGLGIRLGVYFQLLSSLLANHYHHEIMKDAWDTNAIFILAVFIGIGRATVMQQLQTVEAFIMLQMLFAFLLSIFQVSTSVGWLALKTMEQKGAQSSLHDLIAAHEEYSTAGVMTRACLRTAISSYNIWFWFKGSESLPTQESCSPIIFLFAPVHLEKAMVFFRVISVLYFYFIGASYFEIALLITGCRRQWRKWNSSDAGHKGTFLQKVKQLGPTLWKWYISSSVLSTSLQDQEPDNKTRGSSSTNKMLMKTIFRGFRRFLMIYDVAIIIWAILTIELTLHWTSISGVYGVESVGQLIALVVGAAGLLRTVHLIIIDKVTIISEIRKKHRIGSMPLVPGTGVWKYRLRDDRTARFLAMDPQQLRRWSSDEPSTKNPTNQRLPPPKPATVDNETLPPPMNPRASSDLDFDLVGSYIARRIKRRRRFSYRGFFSLFGFPEKAERNRRPQEESIPYPELPEWGIRRDQEDFRVHLPSGKIQVFHDWVINRRQSISNEQEAREIGSRMPFTPYLLDSSGHQISGSPVLEFSNINPDPDNVIDGYRELSHLLDTRKRSVMPEAEEPMCSYQLRDGHMVHFEDNVRERRWSDGSLRVVSSETEEVPEPLRAQEEELYYDVRAGTKGKKWKMAFRWKKIVRFLKAIFKVFFFFTMFCLFPVLVILLACLVQLSNEEEQEKEKEKEENGSL